MDNFNPMAGASLPGQIVPFQETTRTFPGASSTTSGKVRNKAVIGLEQNLAETENERLKLNEQDVANAKLRDDAALKRSEDEMARLEQTKIAQAEAERAKAARLDQWRIDEEKQQAAVDKAAGAKGYMEEKPLWFKALAAIVSGLAAGAGSDTPLRLFREAADDDRKKKLLRLDLEQKKLEKLGHAREAIDAYHKEQLAQLGRQEEADLKVFAKQAEQVGLKIPSQQITAQKASADALQEAAKNRMDREAKWAKDSSDTQYGMGMTIRSVDPEGAKSKAGGSEMQGKAALASEGIKRELDIIGKNISSIPKVMQKYQANVSEVEAGEKTATGSIFGAKMVNALRSAPKWMPGSVAASPMEGLTGEEQKMQQAIDASNEFAMRFMSGAAIQGTLNEGEETRMRRAFSFVPGMTAEAVQATKERMEFLQKAIGGLSGPAQRNMALALAEGNLKPGDPIPQELTQAPRAAQPAPAVPNMAPRQERIQFTPREQLDLKWARANQGTPKADEIIRNLRAKKGL